MRSALRAIFQFFPFSSRRPLLHADAPTIELPDQQEIEKALEPPNGRYAAGGFTTLKRAAAGRPDWVSWFQHHGVDPVTHHDQGGGGGGGYLMQYGRMVINAGGSGEGYNRETETRLAGIGAGQGYTDIGYIIARGRFFRVFPLLGAGGLGGAAYITDKSSLDDARRERERIGTAAAEFHIGFGVDVLIPISKFRLVLGMRFGYRLISLEINRDPSRSFDPNANGFFSRVIGGVERVK